MIEEMLQEKEWEVTKIRITREGETRRKRCHEEHLCTACELPFKNGDKPKCGMHGACYQAALRAIEAKKITRRELVAAGKMLPPSKGGRPAVSPFTKELSER